VSMQPQLHTLFIAVLLGVSSQLLGLVALAPEKASLVPIMQKARLVI